MRIKRPVSLLIAITLLLTAILPQTVQAAASACYYPFNRLEHKNGNLCVVIDPGHDSTHKGAKGGGMKEEELNLKIAKYCKEELEKYPQIEVYMTHETLACPRGEGSSSGADNVSRVAFAASKGADLYMSIHLNANNSTSAHGAEVYYQNETHNKEVSRVGKSLSKKILNNLVALGIRKNGIYTRNSENDVHYYDAQGNDEGLADYYTALKKSKDYGFTGIIVEHCYISNAGDRNSFLSSEEKLKALGVADAMGVIEEFGVDKEDYRGVFSPDYYRDKNPDLVSIIGEDGYKLKQHYLKYGIKEGRVPSPCFDLQYYKCMNPDLTQAYGDDDMAYIIHFIHCGMAEGRASSAEFDVNAYKKRYPELVEKYGDDTKSYYVHFAQEGYYEGRNGAVKEIDPVTYKKSDNTAYEYIYRMYDRRTGEHYYSRDTEDCEYKRHWGWSYEGDAFKMPVKSETPVYLMRNPNVNEHHYALSVAERDFLIVQGWEYKGIAFYMPKTEAKGTVAVYRLYNPNALTGNHHYTTGAYERDYLVSLGWSYEGVAWYSFTEDIPEEETEDKTQEDPTEEPETTDDTATKEDAAVVDNKETAALEVPEPAKETSDVEE